MKYLLLALVGGLCAIVWLVGLTATDFNSVILSVGLLAVLLVTGRTT